MRLSDHQAEFLRDLNYLLRVVYGAMPNHRVRGLELKRSIPEQQRLVAEGKSWVRDPYTAPHVESRAIDLALDKRTEYGWSYCTETQDYEMLGEIWENRSPYNRWGGRFGDGNHFERMKTKRVDPEVTA